jgi:hypothetical protein
MSLACQSASELHKLKVCNIEAPWSDRGQWLASFDDEVFGYEGCRIHSNSLPMVCETVVIAGQDRK